ncbi:hypothetical protein OFO94_36245, partial [Escherichia coli]|nr:hypothetical protein [Escherichia coli]
LVDGNIQSQMSMGFARLMNTRNDFGINWETGWKHPGFDSRPGPEYEIESTWQRYIDMRWMTFAGFRFTNLLNKQNTPIAG